MAGCLSQVLLSLASVAVVLLWNGETVMAQHITGGRTNIIYVDEAAGITENSCWVGGEEKPCASLDLALEGAQTMNVEKTVVVIQEGQCSYCESSDISIAGDMVNDSNVSYCPVPWMTVENGSCVCGDDLGGIVNCNDTLKETSLLECYCMTYDESTGRTVVGTCLLACFDSSILTTQNRYGVYNTLPTNIRDLNNIVCGHVKRQGQLCGQCLDGYTPPVYSYTLECLNCSGTNGNWAKYASAAFIPLTFYFIFILMFRITATAPQLNAFILVSQVIVAPPNVRVILAALKSHPGHLAVVHVLTTLFGVWNLDFFRTVMPHICLRLTPLQALAIDYLTAVYPLVLLVIVYIQIELHERNCRLVIWFWKPLHTCFARFRRQWDVKSSVIDSFATFLLLSCTKLLSVSFDLLVAMQVYDEKGRKVGIFLYYAATVEFFGMEHLPFAILALSVLTVFIFIPVMLMIFYHTKCCRKCRIICLRQCRILHTFMEAFQCYYKDGTEGTRDYRWFAAVYIIIRVVLFLAYAITLGAFYYPLAALILIILAILVAIIKPYKARYAVYNTVDTVMIIVAAMWHASVVCIELALDKAAKYVVASYALSALIALIPLFYILAVVLSWLCFRMNCQQKFLQWFPDWRQEALRRVSDAGSDGSLPDRVINPQEYDSTLDVSISEETRPLLGMDGLHTDEDDFIQ